MAIPIRATYRLQLHAGFGFDQAAAIASYLADLGVSHAYCSPYLQAAPGSDHGYDVVDYEQVNRELGGEDGHRRFVAALAAHRLGHVLDIVPNHMAISTEENRWWMDVLENGPSSRFAGYFDVEWAPPEARLRNTVLLPVLGDHYGRVLEAGELRLVRDGASFAVRYADHSYPLDPRSIASLLTRAARQCKSDELAFIGDALAGLPRPTATDRASVRRRHRDIAVLQSELLRLLERDVDCEKAVDQVLAAANTNTADLHEVLEAQSYRLAWWRSAGRDLGYRRFFDINTLIGLRIEDEQVFEETHRLVLSWIHQGVLDGLRIDHTDGLRNPEEYCERLHGVIPGKWIVLEKILEQGEHLRSHWPVAGTTGYDFMNRAVSVLIDPAGEEPLTRFFHEFTGESTDYHSLVVEKKLYVLREVLGSDLNRVADLLLDIIERHPTHRDYSRHHLVDAIREVAAHLPVYRTYVRPERHYVGVEDREYIQQAIAGAASRRSDLERPLFEFVQSLLLLEREGDLELEFVVRFQQLTGPAMAKGLEDTVFYLYNRLVALNEVGGDPSRFGCSVLDFHAAARETQHDWPRTMIATDTHDTKRGEDVRARLALLSEMPAEWAAAVRRWSQMAARHRSDEWPDRNAEYLFYQTLVGAWPLSTDRARAYMEKAAREAKTQTSWVAPHTLYEQALRRFVEGVLNDRDLLADMAAFVEPLIKPGWINALGQALLKLTAPGIPDIYQGTELWALHLVDPDNRRPVEYALRRRALCEVKTLSAEQIWCRADEGLPKLWVVHQALALRQRRPELFDADSSYDAIAAHGDRASHVVAFARGNAVVTLVPRLVWALRGGWGNTSIELPPGHWRNVLTGDDVPASCQLANVLGRFPVALIERSAG